MTKDDIQQHRPKAAEQGESKTGERKPYTAPAIESEEVFETLALSCAMKAGLACMMTPGVTS